MNENLKIHTSLAKPDEQLQYKAEHYILNVHDTILQKYDLRINVINKKIEISNKGENNFKSFSDEDLNSLWVDFQLDINFKGERPSEKLIYKLIYSRLTDKYNAIEEYFSSLQYSGGDAIAEYCKMYQVEPLIIGKDASGKDICITDVWVELFKIWLVNAVACMLGVSANHVMFILAGGQGIGKTTILNNLCPPILYKDYAVIGHIKPDLNDDTTANFLAEKAWINIDDQLDAIFAKDFNAIKSLVTTPKVNNRKKFARFENTRCRIANFVASVNQEKIFTDTENRRYLFIKIISVDYKNKFDVNKVWAMAHHLFKHGYKLGYTKDQEKLLNMINDKYSRLTPELEYFNLCYELAPINTAGAKHVQFSEILSTIKAISGLSMQERNLTTALKKLGIVSKSVRLTNGGSRYVYELREKFVKLDNGKLEFMKM